MRYISFEPILIQEVYRDLLQLLQGLNIKDKEVVKNEANADKRETIEKI